MESKLSVQFTTIFQVAIVLLEQLVMHSNIVKYIEILHNQKKKIHAIHRHVKLEHYVVDLAVVLYVNAFLDIRAILTIEGVTLNVQSILIVL